MKVLIGLNGNTEPEKENINTSTYALHDHPAEDFD